jgi:hypothetical protein
MLILHKRTKMIFFLRALISVNNHSDTDEKDEDGGSVRLQKGNGTVHLRQEYCHRR